MRKALWVLFLFFMPFISEAYQLSGYISLRWVTGNTYQATIVDYTVGNPNLDSVSISWGDGTSAWIHRSNGSGDSVCDSIIMSMYTGVHTFPGVGTYRIWMNGGSRIANIVNMTNSAGQDLVLFNTLTLNPFAGNNITSPVITNAPICSYGCLGHCYTFNPAASSVLGDSLVYSLGTCMTTGYFIPANATINSVTGLLSWCNPDSTGLYNFSIRIVVYRNVVNGNSTYHIPVDTEEVELEANVQANCVLGINEISSIFNYSVYPNPSNGSFTIKSSALNNRASVEVYNMLGQQVYAAKLNTANTQIDLRNNASGLYLYRMLTETGALVSEGKFIIQK